MIADVDYGAGNLFSVKNALDFLSLRSKVTRDAVEISAADGIILPGVGAFPDAMRMLEEAASEKQAVIYCHDAYTQCTTVKKVNDFFKADQKVSLFSIG